MNYVARGEGLGSARAHPRPDASTSAERGSKSDPAELGRRVDAKIAEIDAIVHHGDFQRIEAAWRTRELVVDRVDFRENIRVEFLNVSKEDLILDMEDSGFQARHGAFAASTTGLVKRLTQTWSGGVCHSIVVGEYEFGHDANDPALRTCIAEARRRRVARSPSSS